MLDVVRDLMKHVRVDWAAIWERHFEQGMSKPEAAEDWFDFEDAN
jgi:hypothetical protein